MLALTRKTDYALVALCYLANARDRLCCAREIAEQHGMPLAIVMNIMKSLAKFGMVRSVRGSRGGYGLADDPVNITLGAIVNAIEGPVRLFACADAGDEPGVCEHQSACPIVAPAQRISGKFQNFLNKLSLAEIVGEFDSAEISAAESKRESGSESESGISGGCQCESRLVSLSDHRSAIGHCAALSEGRAG